MVRVSAVLMKGKAEPGSSCQGQAAYRGCSGSKRVMRLPRVLQFKFSEVPKMRRTFVTSKAFPIPHHSTVNDHIAT
eukprot:5709139-Amphidinium_carterae.1